MSTRALSGLRSLAASTSGHVTTVVGALAVAVCAFAAGCTSERIVFRNGANFPTPAAAAGNFLGYYDNANKQTVCGSCHIDYQTRWSTTRHHNAWNDLQASGHATGSCEKCHSVNNLGNAVTDTAVGYRSTKDARTRLPKS